ncbi:PHP domain-containing protein, partial [uncultured Deinococcus sp.]
MTAPDAAPASHIHLPDGSCCKPKRFAHLHQHTQYSLLDGAAKLKDLLKWAKEVTPEGQTPALAMTDHGNMHGAVHFYNYATGMGVKPIIGYEAYVVPGQGTRRDRTRGQDGEKGIFHLTLLARDFEGYQNLCRLSSRGYTEGYYYKPRIDHELLQEHHKGVIAFSGCLGSEVQQLLMQGREADAKARLLWYRDLFGENYYIEIQDHGLPEQRKNNPILKAWAQELGIGMVATNDGHYVKKSDATAHETLLAIQTKATLADENRFKFPCDEFYVKDLEEMQAA